MNKLAQSLAHNQDPQQESWVIPFGQLRMTDVDSVGGKNSSLGEMISQLGSAGVRVPGGFATTASAFRAFLDFGGLRERINQRLDSLNVEDVRALAACGDAIRQMVLQTPLPPALESQIRAHYEALIKDSPGSRLPFDHRLPRRICPMRRLPGSRNPISMSMASMRSSIESSTFLHRFITTVPLAIGCTRDLLMPMSRSQQEYNGWCAPT